VPQLAPVVKAKVVAKCKKGFVRRRGRCVRQAKGKAGKASVGRVRGERGAGS
jgi:hypothetical protein